MLNKIKQAIISANNTKYMEKDIDTIFDSNEGESPYFESIKITIKYGVIGALWILLSDKILAFFVEDHLNYEIIQTYKGWFFILATMVLLYFLVRNRLVLFYEAKKKIFDAYEELNAVHEEQVALEEELRMQYDELEISRDALLESEKRLEFLAYTDTLTNIPNRTMFELTINDLIKDKIHKKSKFALIDMDIDNFKQINDTIGHSEGDVLLKYIAEVLKEQIKFPDFVARLSGDEFILILENIEDNQQVIDRIEQLLKLLRRPWVIEDQEFFISYSIGVTVFPDDGQDLKTLLKNADTAMYHIKEREKDDYCFYDESMMERTIAYTRMKNELRHAIDNQEFILYYQPLVSLESGRIIGVEALIRWKHPEKGFIPPMEFIPLAEEVGYINDIGSWVIKTACEQKKAWKDQGYDDLKISVNISGKRLTGCSLIDEVKDIIKDTELDLNGLQMEITETAVMQDMENAIKCLEQLKEFGISIALDDFGTGYSSLTYLKRLPIDTVKMDREFIKNIATNYESEMIVKLVIQLIHDLNLEAVAEGIETVEQLQYLGKYGCDIGQGYLFSRPLPASEIEKLLKADKAKN